jgi:hypothetical protein
VDIEYELAIADDRRFVRQLPSPICDGFRFGAVAQKFYLNHTGSELYGFGF